jgi:hypothetical protein
MANRRKAVPVTLTEGQREKIERLWFYYGNYGPEATPGNHQFIQGLLEHGLDLRPLHTKRTPKSGRPTGECEAAVDAVLAADDGHTGNSAGRRGVLRLVPSPDASGEFMMPDPELKVLLEDIRRRHFAQRGRAGGRPTGGDAA